METSTTIRHMLAGNRIFVPTYQFGYSWETETENVKTNKQVNIFLSDLEEYIQSETKSKYYFGHFLFEEKESHKFAIIDGQQRITTIVIFLSALFRSLETIRPLREEEELLKEDTIIRKSLCRFETAENDDQFFKDYVINQTKKDKNNLKTVSAKHIASAFDFFTSYLKDKEEVYLLQMLITIQNSICTTHLVKDEVEAMKMYLFHNNRGKKRSVLNNLKVQLCLMTSEE